MRKWVYICAIVISYTLADKTNAQVQRPVYNETDYTEIIKVVLSYMECEDCTDGEFETLSANKRVVTPYLIQTFQKGPSASRLSTLRVDLEKSFDQFYPSETEQSKKKQFVDTYIQKTTNRYYIRSATALKNLKIEGARDLLTSALSRNDLQTEVKTIITELLKTL